VFSDNSVFKVFPGEMKDPSQWKAFAICTLHRRRCGNEELSSYDIVNSITNDKITAVRLY
jgi:hypothetical protein